MWKNEQNLTTVSAHCGYLMLFMEKMILSAELRTLLFASRLSLEKRATVIHEWLILFGCLLRIKLKRGSENDEALYLEESWSSSANNRDDTENRLLK